MKNDDLIIAWAVISIFSPLVFLFLSFLKISKIQDRTFFKNYFSYYVIFHVSFLLFARCVFFEYGTDFLNAEHLLLYGLPILIVLAYIQKKTWYVWLFFLYVFGVFIVYGENVSAPGASIALILQVIIEEVLISVSYFWYLNRYFKTDLTNSLKIVKHWLFDFDKSRTLKALAPYLLLLTTVIGFLVIFLIKFLRVIFYEIFR